MYELHFNLKGMLIFVFFIALIIFWIRWRMRKLKTFEELGIPGPSPHFVFGNLLDITEKGLLKCHDEWVKKYGEIFGYFNGLNPVLCVADKNILKRIFIKDFHLFSSRPEVVPLRVHSIFDPIIPATPIMDSLLLNKNGEEWKRIRSKLSPVFSVNKLKMMIPFVDDLTDVTISILGKKAKKGEVIDIYAALQYLTLDIISAQAFAVHTDTQTEGPGHPFFRSAITILDNPTATKIMIFGNCFPELGLLGMMINFLRMFFVNGFTIPPLQICNLVDKIVQQRRKDPKMRRPDMLQSLIDASNPETMDLSTKPEDDLDADSLPRKDFDNSIKPLKTKDEQGLSDYEIQASALIVLLAGFETTSSSLAYVIYFLAKYPEYQVQMQKEIDLCTKDKLLDYYVLKSLQFMERFMMETMRFYPPAVTSVHRIATASFDLEGIHIPKGMHITVPVNYMHFCEDNWENPEVFDPNRFLTQTRKPNSELSYWAFGYGPRNCVGVRLANITSKIILLKLLQRFSFELPDDPKEATLTLNLKYATMVPVKAIVRIKERVQSADM